MDDHMNDPETIKTIAWTVAFVFGLQGLTIYAIVHLLATGRGVIERRERDPHEARGRIVGMER